MNVPKIKITDKYGVPMKRSATAYRGAGGHHPSLSNWRAGRYSGHAALRESREVLNDRIHDMARNDGWASAAMSRYVDTIVGSGWRLSSKPNHVTLGITREQADEVSDQIEALWHDATNDPGFWMDAERAQSPAGQLGLATRHQFADGEAIGWIGYREEAPTGFATCVQVIDPMRLSNPYGMMDSDTMKDGVEVDEWGAATRYHIRKSHPGDMVWGSGNSHVWEAFDRETEWGRPIIIHLRDKKWAGMSRGEAVLAPVITKLRQIHDYDDYELQAAALNAMLAAFVTTPMDPEIMDEESTDVSAYAQSEVEYYGKNPLEMEGVQLGFLHPGSQINTIKAEHPSANNEPFVRNAIRNIASAAGITYEAMSADYSQANYSSIRASIVEFRRGFASRSKMVGSMWQGQIYRAQLEEFFDKGLIKLPANAPSYEAAPVAWGHATWIGPAAGWVDPKKESEASVIKMANGLSTMEKENAEQGDDWKENIYQMARERDLKIKHGLNPDIGRPEARIQSVSSMDDGDEDSDERDERENRENAVAGMVRAKGRSLVPQIRR